MHVSIFGLLVVVIGAILMFRPAVEMLAFMAVWTLFAGAGALELTALGGSSIPPATFALAPLALRLLRGDVLRGRALLSSLETNSWLLIFCFYGAATAMVLPRMFAGQVDLISMSSPGLGPRPLQVTAQNLTTAVYLLGTAFTAFAATAITLREGSPTKLIKTFVWIAWIHAGTGLLDVFLSLGHLEGFFDFFRNGSYAQLDQFQGGFRRISALCPETSVYADLGSVYFAFMAELWIRGIRPRSTGPAALAVLVLLVVTTSSTAYLALGGYSLILLFRGLVTPSSLPLRKAVYVVAIVILGVTVALTVALLHPALVDNFTRAVLAMTVNKNQSWSAVERSSWAQQGLKAVAASGGLGVGVGSFRSSSLILAIVGSIGPAGLLVFLGYVVHVAKLGRRTTYASRVDLRTGAGAAAGWAAVTALIPQSLIGASADPGVIFAMMAGISLGWRAAPLAAAAPVRRTEALPQGVQPQPAGR